jgi:hypothetical protein
MTFQDVEQALSTENKKEQDVVAVRLENIKLKNKLKKKEHQLKSKVISFFVDCVSFCIMSLLRIKPRASDTIVQRLSNHTKPPTPS